jgi:hemerythrin superfamily protein
MTEPQTPSAPDVVQLLTRQHREVEACMQALLKAEDEDERATLLARATDDLAVHLDAEEQVFYPAVRAARTEDILLESLEEHLSLKRLVADLLVLSPGDTTFPPKCKVLSEQAEHHHKEEEEHLFPKVVKLLDAGARQKLGAAVQAHEASLRLRGAPRDAMSEQTDAAEPLVGGVAAGD